MNFFGQHIWRWVVIFLPFQAIAQNLVPNPGFENYNTCPSGISGIAYSPGYTSFPTVKDWVNPVNTSSPDYLNTCATAATGVSLPANSFGYQLPHNGSGIAGLNVWQGSYTNGILTTDYREYIQTKLLQPLQAGQRYCISFYISPSINISGNFNFVALDEIGANLSTTQNTVSSGYTMSLPYHLVSPAGQFLTDTLNWKQLSGVYIATGGEQWLTLGCFTHNGSIPNKVQAYPLPANTNLSSERAYMFIDDVSVQMISNADTLFTFHDSSFCTWSAMPMKLKSLADDAVYTWNGGENSKEIVVSSPGSYKCIAKTSCQVYIDSFIVQYKDDTRLEFKKYFVNCEDKPIEIKADKAFDTYQWSTGESTQTITVTKSGEYILTGTNRCGTQTDTAKVFIQPPTAPPVVADTIICQLAEDVKLNVSGQNLSWYWHPAGIVGIPVQPQIVTRQLTKTTVYVTQTVGKCESEKAAITVDIKYQPRHVLDDKAIMCLNDIQVIGKDLGVHEITYKWGTGDPTCCIKPGHEGYNRIAISSPYCGTYIDSINVVFSICDTCIILPNAFSPNHDNKNDEFKAIMTCPIADYHMSIFDRWGRKVFEGFDLNHGWDGRIKDDLAENGVYVYTLEYRSASTNQVKFLQGNVTLFR